MLTRGFYHLLVLSLCVDKHSKVWADDTVPLDIVFLIDVSLSFDEDLPRFKEVVANIVERTEDLSDATQYGLAHFSDFNVPQFGRPEDIDYRRDMDLTDDTTQFIAAAMALPQLHGNDEAESSLRAVTRAVNDTDLNIRMNFREEARKVVVLWSDAKVSKSAYHTVQHPDCLSVQQSGHDRTRLSRTFICHDD